jgi:hypothetical protein
MVRQLGKLNNETKIAMTQQLLLTKLEGKSPMALDSPSRSFQENLEFDRTPKERFFDKITVVNSKNFLPQISNLTSQSGPSLISGTPPFSQDVLSFGTEDTNLEPGILSLTNGSTSEPSLNQSAASVRSLEHAISQQESVTSAHSNDPELLKIDVASSAIETLDDMVLVSHKAGMYCF